MTYSRRDCESRRPSSATIVARVSKAERDALQRLAAASDRTLSREVRRAIRLYVRDPEGADRRLRESRGEEPDR